nr:Phage-like element PbsX protein XkdW [uncultured Mediterranean phage uvMED]
MANLSTKIKIWCANNGVANVDFMKDVMLEDKNDGKGAYIKEWNLDIAQPTDAQLLAVESDADKMERNNQVIETRKSLYGSWDKQLEEINEQGLDAWKERIAQIKTDNPKE